MTFELEMALDALNGKIDKGVEFPKAIDLILKMYPVSQEELTIAYDNQPAEFSRSQSVCLSRAGSPLMTDTQAAPPAPPTQITDYACLFKQEKDSTLYQLDYNNVMFELINMPDSTVNHNVFSCGRWISLGNKTMQEVIQWASGQSLPS